MISDGVTKAGGNGETFFTYLNTAGKEFNIDTYFILSVDSEDFARLCKIGKVIPFESRRCKLLVLLCDKIISSQEDGHIFDCFWTNPICIRIYCIDRECAFCHMTLFKMM